jgi:hypothetical protein
MMAPVLRLAEDIFSNLAATVTLAELARMIYVVHGVVNIDGRDHGSDETWHGEGEVTLRSGKTGATIWRFELAPGPADAGTIEGSGIRSHEKISSPLATLPRGELLLRGDSVAFPPGCCAFTHVHQGPGIRCLIEGGIRIDTNGRSTSYGPGGAWFESGPAAVFAQAASDRPSRFIRAMILPRTLLGKSSIRYLEDADKDKPKLQKYRIFVDAPIAFVGRSGGEETV